MVSFTESRASFLAPMLGYLDTLEEEGTQRDVVVVLPQLVPEHAWEGLLHNRTAARLKKALSRRPGTTIVEVPYSLASPD